MPNEMASNSLPFIQPKLDIFAILILLGVIQGIVLSFFFLSKKNRSILSNKIFGLALIVLSAMCFEVFLGHTGYIVKVIYLVDFSEPLTFAIAPLFYLFIFSKISEKNNLRFRQYLHFIPFILYSLYSILFYMQGKAYKFNSFLWAFRPEMPYLQSKTTINPELLDLRQYILELALFQYFLYSVMVFYIIYRALKRENLPFFSLKNKAVSWLRNFTLLALLGVIIIFVVKTSFERDLGDYIIASYMTILIYSISFTVIRRSSFFSEIIFSKIQKYKKSSLTEEMQQKILEKLQKVMEEEKPYLDYSISLPSLAKSIGISPHHLSQVLNDCLNKNFFSYVAFYRAEEAKKILTAPENVNLTIEEIAENVGYYSKSAFNRAFKEQTGMTPSQFREMKVCKNTEN